MLSCTLFVGKSLLPYLLPYLLQQYPDGRSDGVTSTVICECFMTHLRNDQCTDAIQYTDC